MDQPYHMVCTRSYSGYEIYSSALARPGASMLAFMGWLDLFTQTWPVHLLFSKGGWHRQQERCIHKDMNSVCKSSVCCCIFIQTIRRRLTTIYCVKITHFTNSPVLNRIFFFDDCKFTSTSVVFFLLFPYRSTPRANTGIAAYADWARRISSPLINSPSKFQ